MAESLTTEYKNSFGKETIISLVAFANTAGGAVTNPGRLYGTLTLAELEGNQYVSSLQNRLIAEAFYLTGDIERYGTGYIRIREYLTAYPDLKLLVEEQGDFFRAELQLTAPQVTAQVTAQVIKLMQLLDQPKSRQDLQAALGLVHREHFRREYLQPALKAELIAMTNPEKPRAADQQYVLTNKGRDELERQL